MKLVLFKIDKSECVSGDGLGWQHELSCSLRTDSWLCSEDEDGSFSYDQAVVRVF